MLKQKIGMFSKGNGTPKILGKSMLVKYYFICLDMDVEPKIGGVYPPKWMVNRMENPMNKWMIWGKKPYFLKHPYNEHLHILKLISHLQRSRKPTGNSCLKPNVPATVMEWVSKQFRNY